MNTLHYLLATAGHVDHGKSTLIQALTGIDPDRLPEEKARGITIDLGFAHVALPHSTLPATTLQIGIIDVPGHEDYIANMAAGTAAADVALLLVAANEGWKPQTQEHFEILQYQRAPGLIVVISKSDLTPVPDLREQIRDRLANTAHAQAPVVEISAATGANLDILRRTLAETLAAIEPKADAGKPRLFIDRVFKRQGLGSVVTGSLIGGQLTANGHLLAEPGGALVRIRALQSHNQPIPAAQPGMRVAANIPDLPAGITRGHVLLAPETAGASRTLDVRLHRLATPETRRPPLRSGAHVRMQIATADLPARIFLINSETLSPGESAFAQIRLNVPWPAFIGDRIVLRDWSRRRTLAGGHVLDLDTPPSRLRAPTRLSRLQRLYAAASQNDLPSFLADYLPTDRPAPIKTLLARSHWLRDAISAAVERAVTDCTIAAQAQTICRRPFFDGLCTAARELLEAHQRQRPIDPAMSLADFKSALTTRHATPDLIDAVLQSLAPTLLIHANRIRLAAHRPELPALLAPAERRIREALSTRPFDPPSRDQLATDLRARQALQYLLATGDAIAVAPAVVLSRAAHDAAITRIRQHLALHHHATVAELKTLLGSTRRIMVPLLEYLDARKITARRGDLRILPDARLPEAAHVGI